MLLKQYSLTGWEIMLIFFSLGGLVGSAGVTWWWFLVALIGYYLFSVVGGLWLAKTQPTRDKLAEEFIRQMKAQSNPPKGSNLEN